VFRRQGAVEHADEGVLRIKARADDYPALEQRLLALHPYEVPELLALPVQAGNPAYLAWLEARGG
jgi:periplasmic divalent cation tolerance protein